VLPAAGSRYLVPFASVVQKFFWNLSTFFSFGIPIEKRSPSQLFLSPGSFLPRSVRAEPGCLAARRRLPPLKAAVEGAAIWSSS
jgi:hypothetical protein